MPRYTYRCDACEEYFEAVHSINDKLTTCECGVEGSLVRVPSVPFKVSGRTSHNPGQVVKEFIEDAKKEISDYKKDMMRGFDDT